MNKQNQIGKEKAYLFYEMSLFADTIIYVKNHMESTPKKLLEQVSLVRLQDKRPNTGMLFLLAVKNWKLKFTKQYYSIKKSVLFTDKSDKRYVLPLQKQTNIVKRN